MRSKVVTIGIAPWGLLKRHEKLIGKDIVVSYDPHSFSSKSKYATLNDRHSYFLLVDNGTNGRYYHLSVILFLLYVFCSSTNDAW